MNKPMLGVDDLILHMKSKGIAFTEMSEDDAKAYLHKNNNYFIIIFTNIGYGYDRRKKEKYEKSIIYSLGACPVPVSVCLRWWQ